MDKITAVKSKLKLQQWAERIAECQTSSMTVVAWCEANNINIKSYYYWLKKLRETVAETASPRLVHLEAPVPQSEGILRIQIGQADLRLPVNTDAEAVAAILRALQQLC